MTLCRMIAPEWLLTKKPGTRRVLEGMFTNAQIQQHNHEGYNVYYLPNGPREYQGGTVDGSNIDDFHYCFVDFDLKSGAYTSKESFIEALAETAFPPTKVIDSGNGIHAYWKITDLDAKSYLRLTRRLMRTLNTDEATCSIYQLMRLPGTLNTKNPAYLVPCAELYDSTDTYTCEELSKLLPPITVADEQFCQNHFDKTYNRESAARVDDTLPPKFGKLLSENHEAQELFAGSQDDRSKSDFRLGHIMLAAGFSRQEALSVLVNTAKAMSRSPVHRVSYAENIVDKIWTYETEEKPQELSSSIEDILRRSNGTIKGTPFRCHQRIDNTEHGFRLGQVIGLVAGSGVGKTAFALNMFRWFCESNPDYHHFFIPLEQPANEIADRWQTMCGDDSSLHKKVHVMSNYDADGNFRHLSLEDIQEHIVAWEKTTGHKVGCVVIDHIGVLKKRGANDEKQDLMTICHQMKAFAVQTNTLLVMQSQSSREKAGIGDLELNKDAAYGTIFFEAYCDYLIGIWQPLKRMHHDPACPTVTAFKFAKIRHKKARKDKIQEDVPYFFYFDSELELLRDMTQDEITAFNYFLPKATNKRKADRKTELLNYQSVPYQEGVVGVSETDDNRLAKRHSGTH